MARDPIYFTVDGLEPADDPHWIHATKAQKAAFLRVCRVLVLTEWDRQTAAGLGANGRKLAPLERRRSAMGPADPYAPPLQPAHELSRTRSLVDAKVIGLTIRVFWRFDPISGKRWGTILGYHRDGRGHLPRRNVFGLSAPRRRAVIKQAHLWWEGYSRRMATAMPLRPRPGKAARPPLAILPTPVTANHPDQVASQNLAIGETVLTVTGGTRGAAALLAAIKAGTFTGGKSYAGAK